MVHELKLTHYQRWALNFLDRPQPKNYSLAPSKELEASGPIRAEVRASVLFQESSMRSRPGSGSLVDSLASLADF